ncbi:ATPase, F1/V1/A1 complex, alpha/beta subunit, partial [Tanacetum coccineum]
LDLVTRHFKVPNSCVGGAEVVVGSSGEVNKDSSVSPKECEIDLATSVACESIDAATNENGPWFIQFVPIIVKKWTPNANLLKEDLCSIPVWVKIHDIPILAFTKDVSSAMATRLGNLIMFDSYSSSMCMIEYEWEPPRCRMCMVFGHDDMTCLKRVVDEPKKESGKNNDEFQLAPKRAFHARPKSFIDLSGDNVALQDDEVNTHSLDGVDIDDSDDASLRDNFD